MHRLRLVEIDHHPPDAPQVGIVQRRARLDDLLTVLQDEAGDGEARILGADGLDGLAAAASHVDEKRALRGVRGRVCLRGDGPAEVVYARYGHALLDRSHAAHEPAHALRVPFEQLVVAQLGVAVGERRGHVSESLRFLAAVGVEVVRVLRIDYETIFPAVVFRLGRKASQFLRRKALQPPVLRIAEQG